MPYYAKPFAPMLNYGHPQAAGLKLAYVFDSYGSKNVQELAARKFGPGILNGGFGWTRGLYGAAATFDGTGGCYLEANTGVGFGTLLGTTGYTVLCRFMTTNAADRRSVFGDFDSSGSNNSLDLETSVVTIGGSRLGMVQGIGGGNNIINSGKDINSNQWYTVVIRWDGSTISFFVDGVLTASAALSGVMDPGVGIRLGAAGQYTGLTLNGGIEVFLAWDRFLSMHSCRRISADPFALFRPTYRLPISGAMPTSASTKGRRTLYLRSGSRGVA